jgi:hypothetical protein
VVGLGDDDASCEVVRVPSAAAERVVLWCGALACVSSNAELVGGGRREGRFSDGGVAAAPKLPKINRARCGHQSKEGSLEHVSIVAAFSTARVGGLSECIQNPPLTACPPSSRDKYSMASFWSVVTIFGRPTAPKIATLIAHWGGNLTRPTVWVEGTCSSMWAARQTTPRRCVWWYGCPEAAAPPPWSSRRRFHARGGGVPYGMAYGVVAAATIHQYYSKPRSIDRLKNAVTTHVDWILVFSFYCLLL